MITTPTYKTYYKFINPLTEEKNLETIKTICKKYDCAYHDYFRDSRFNLMDFSDNDHLNSNGAKKFTEIINKDIISKVCPK